ncbi:DksA/TraR family C4-type zinc finger protein [Paracoccus suum]|uniref:DksA/TraR family C4-type zinc finger protein n=1 Tax=Paracoccus suum TaxID=2259340 RepID=A0A344PP74_9RHOB|nr:DksA/TraR family C4-type zinc finger protein [Paracoccus suum]AXC51179.1 DksA/TraR family C4-type zinc finger protein [Paracoccus suum]
MAGGWAQDGAVNEQIEVSTREAIERMRRQRPGEGRPSRETCAECDEPIPEARRAAIPGVQLCIECQQASDKTWRPAAGINRRGSKDSQLR